MPIYSIVILREGGGSTSLHQSLLRQDRQRFGRLKVTTENSQSTNGVKLPSYQLAQLLAKYEPKHRHSEQDWGKPKGKETW
jgi:hypothetical protein